MKKLDMNMIIGVLCAAGLVFLFSKWGAEIIFGPKVEHHASEDGHDDGHVAQAYTIDTGASEGHSDATDAANPAVFLAAANAETGEKIYKKCAACHKLDANGTGPMLGGIGGKAAGSVEGFAYSAAMLESGLTWDAPTLFKFLGDVKGTVPGTKMSFAGIKNEQERADLVAYLMGDAFDAAAFAAEAAAPAEEAHSEEATGEEATQTTAALPAGDAAVGENVFKKCKACHSVEAGKNGTGPSLAGIIGKSAGTVEGFKYSQAMAESGLTWDEATLAAFLANPKAVVAKTKMSFAGLKKEDEIANVIAYLAQH